MSRINAGLAHAAFQHQVRHLRQQPAGHDVTESYPDYISAFELVEQGQWLATVWPLLPLRVAAQPVYAI